MAAGAIRFPKTRPVKSKENRQALAALRTRTGGSEPRMVGSTGVDMLQGGGRATTILGRQGADVLSGGMGQDFFAFAAMDFDA